jgi:hypothetical protein
MSEIYLRKYGVEATVDYELFEIDGVDFRVDAVYASGDVKIMKDEGAEANTTNGFTDEGTGYSHVITATEMQAARIVLYAVDQTGTKAWLDKKVIIETYGHASAQHAMDFDDPVRGGLTALPNAAAGAAGGIPLSTAGSLEMDTLADWINGGRLDLLLDAIPTTAMRGTDSAATAASLATHDGKLDDAMGATFATGTDSLEAIRNRGDAAWTTGGGGAGWTSVITESYAAAGAEATPAQLLYMLLALLSETDIINLIKTSYKLDGATPAMTHTVNNADRPTKIGRTT